LFDLLLISLSISDYGYMLIGYRTLPKDISDVADSALLLSKEGK
jgi:hypothetical protein